MLQDLEKYFQHLYRNTTISHIPDVIPQFRNKSEIDIWFAQIKRKDVLLTEYRKNLKEMEKKEQHASATIEGVAIADTDLKDTDRDDISIANAITKMANETPTSDTPIPNTLADIFK